MQLKGLFDQRCFVMLLVRQWHNLPWAGAEVALGVARSDALGRSSQHLSHHSFDEVRLLLSNADSDGLAR